MNRYSNSLVIKEAKLKQQCNNTTHPKRQERKRERESGREVKGGRERSKEGRKEGKRMKNEQIIASIDTDLD